MVSCCPLQKIELTDSKVKIMDIVKNILTSTDKANFLSSTDNLTKLVSRFEKFTNENETEEQKYQRLCKLVITIRVLYVLTIFVAFSNFLLLIL